MKKSTRQTITFYLKYLKQFKGYTLLSALFITLAVGLQMAFPALFGWFIDTLVNGADTLDSSIVVQNLLKILVVIVSVDVMNHISWRVLIYSIIRLQSKGMREITNECFEFLHQHSYRFFSDNFTGSLVKKVGRMTRAFETITDIVFFELAGIGIKLVISIVVLSSISLTLGVPLMIFAASFLAFNYFMAMYKLKRFDIPKVKAETKVTGTLADTITNYSNIKLFDGMPREILNFKKDTQDLYTKRLRSWNFDNHIEVVQGVMMIVLNFLVFYFAIQLWEAGQITVGNFVLIQGYILFLFQELWDFGRVVRRLYSAFADAEEMTEIIHTKIEVKNKKRAKAIEVRHGKIQFKKVDFSYKGGKNILHDFSFKLNPSEKVALIGPSGGGKSTITKLMLRLFDITGGEILIDGQNIADATQESLRSQISLVPQDPILFHRSLRDNIAYGREGASEEEIIAAAKLANCHDFIMSFPQKYDTFVGERGVKLSGGERQRVAIARAILSNTRILVLDEATSSLDSESEKLIQDALKNLMKNKTTLVIAHRLSTIVGMDRILVLEGGKIVEQGSHATLSRKQGGLYEKLWGMQVGGYLGE